MEVLALIPARGGSKGLPGKNIADFCGHPLLAYSILAGQECPLIDRVILDTDDGAIAEVGKRYGADMPYRRPDAFAQDHSTDLDVFRHSLQWLAENEGYRPDMVVQLRPTAPVRFMEDIVRAIRLLEQHPEMDSVRSIIPSPTTPYKMWVDKGDEQAMEPLLSLEGVDEPYNMPRQQLPTIYWHTGTIDVIRPRVILEQNSMSGKKILPLKIDPSHVTDIDTKEEFEHAQQVMRESDCIKFS